MTIGQHPVFIRTAFVPGETQPLEKRLCAIKIVAGQYGGHTLLHPWFLSSNPRPETCCLGSVSSRSAPSNVRTLEPLDDQAPQIDLDLSLIQCSRYSR